MIKNKRRERKEYIRVIGILWFFLIRGIKFLSTIVQDLQSICLAYDCMATICPVWYIAAMV
jgi:hypothetical protein